MLKNISFVFILSRKGPVTPVATVLAQCCENPATCLDFTAKYVAEILHLWHLTVSTHHLAANEL